MKKKTQKSFGRTGPEEKKMEITIGNGKLTVVISEKGAELRSIKSADGTEYLWQGNPRYWSDRALNLFPYVARLTDGTYTLHGKTYGMPIHGFLPSAVTSAENITETCADFVLRSNEETMRMYPYDFEYRIRYLLEGKCLKIESKVMNRSGEMMYFGLGGHPGFNVPLGEDEVFEDYSLEFGAQCRPFRVGFTERCYLSGEDRPYPLEDGIRIPLRHDLFDEDAVVLKHMDRTVTLKGGKSGRGVRVKFDGFPYLGIWHMPKTDAGYVCIEPWLSLPSRDGIVEELSQQADLIHLSPGQLYSLSWSVEILG